MGGAAKRLNGRAKNIDLAVAGLTHIETDTGARSNPKERLRRLFKNLFSVRDKKDTPRALLLGVERRQPCLA